MKRKIFNILFALVLVVSFSLVTAVPVVAQDGTYLGTPPTIDGDLSEWESAGTQYIYADGCLGGEQIGTGKLYIAFDDDNFYLAYKLEDAGLGDDYLYAFNGGFWFPDASGYNSSAPQPSEFVLTNSTLELRQSWSGVRGAGAVYGEWMIEIVSNNAARIIRLGSMQATTGLVTNLNFYAGSYDGEDPFPGSYITDGVSKDLWVLTGFSAFDPYFGQYSVHPGEVWVDDGFDSSTAGWGLTHFATIQDGINAVAEAGMVNVLAGTYAENITIDRSLTLLGAQANEEPIVDGVVRSGEESIISVPGTSTTGITVLADDVVVNGFEIANGYHSIACNIERDVHENVEILYNYIHSNKAWGGISLMVTGGDGSPVTFRNFVISHNYVNLEARYPGKNNTHAAVGMSSGEPKSSYATYDQLEISYNTLTNPYGHGIFCGANPNAYELTSPVIVHNYIYDCNQWAAAINVGNMHEAIISNNILEGNGLGALLGVLGGTVADNVFRDTYPSPWWPESYGLLFWGAGGDSPFPIGSHHVTVTGNSFYFNNYLDSEHPEYGAGLLPGCDASTIEFHYNSFFDGGAVEGAFALVNYAEGVIDATNNWWGTVNGPTHAGNTFNVGEQGGTVSDNVLYVPWLDAPGGIGFAPVRTTDPEGSFASIQAGVTASNAAGMVNVLAGTYAENVVIPAGKDNLQIVGNSKDDTFVTCGTGAAFKTNSPVTIKGFDISGQERGKGTAISIRDKASGCPSSASGTVGNPGVFADNRCHDLNYGMQSADHCTEYWNFIGNDFSELRIGIGLENMSYIKIVGNTFADYKEGVSMGWDADTAHQVEIKDNMFLGDFAGGTDNLAAIVISSAAIDIDVSGNDITDSIVGVLIKQKDATVPDLTNVNINFNNIEGNTTGVLNESTEEVDATNNWWGHASGPSDIGPGTGDAVSDYVDYEPWLGAGVEDSKSETTATGDQTVDATTEADTKVDKSGTGTPTITVAEYSSNPGTGFSGDIGKYVDIHIDDPTGVDEIVIKVYYTDAEIGGRVESSLRLRWWNGDSWVACSDSGVNTTDIAGTPAYSGYMWAKVRSDDTVPTLAQLSGTAFGGHGGTAPPPPPPTVTLESIAASPSSLTLDVDETQQLTVTATYSDESTDDVTAEASYESSDTSVTTVSDAGLITGVAEGLAAITVSYTEDEITRTVDVTVEIMPLFEPMEYDADGDGVIDKSEALAAVVDYFDGFITKENALAVIAEYME